MASSEGVWDCIVVGAGIVGMWTANHLAAKGLRTLVLEQFQLPHSRGSSGGHSRIIRQVYNEDFYAEMMPECNALWKKLENDYGKTLFVKTGLLLLEEGDNQGIITQCRSAMDKFSLPYTMLSADNIRSRYPMLKYDASARALLDETAGLLLPGRCINALTKQFEGMGGVIEDGVKVESITPGSTVTLNTKSGKYYAKKIVLAAGPWSLDILNGLGINIPLKTMPGCSAFVGDTTAPPGDFSVDNGCPIGYQYLRYKPGEYRFVCFFPSYEYPNMVKMVTRGEPPPYYCHPDERDQAGNQELVKIVGQYVRDHLTGLEDKPSILEPCMYTMTPDKHYVLDKHPKHSNIVIGAGFSGHGYMRAPVIGRLLTELVTSKSPPSPSMRLFRIGRFRTDCTIPILFQAFSFTSLCLP